MIFTAKQMGASERSSAGRMAAEDHKEESSLGSLLSKSLLAS